MSDPRSQTTRGPGMRYTGGYRRGHIVTDGEDTVHHHRIFSRFYDLCADRGYTHPNGALRMKQLIELLNYDRNQIHKLAYNPANPHFSMQMLLTVCMAFQCQPGDLLVYVPGKKRPSPRRKYQRILDYTDLAED